MKQILLMDTEAGKVPILVINKIVNDCEIFEGKILDSNSIHIQSLSLSGCISELKKAFELELHFWVRNQLLSENIIYEQSINKSKDIN